MSNRSFFLSDGLYKYLLENSLREPAILQALREETARDEMARMQIAPEQGQFIQLIMRLVQARRGIEVGVFTGYSSLCAALAMPTDGYLLACDVSEEWTSIARRYWDEAGVSAKIDLHLAPALDTLDSVLANGQAGTYDYAFIDADKENYIGYYERCLALLRPGGLMLVDNVLWSGTVADEANQEPDTLALRAFNRHVHQDDRVELSMLPLADGLSLLLKR